MLSSQNELRDTFPDMHWLIYSRVLLGIWIKNDQLEKAISDINSLQPIKPMGLLSYSNHMEGSLSFAYVIRSYQKSNSAGK